MAERSRKIYPIRKNGRFYFDEGHKPESLLFGTIPSFVKSLFSRRKLDLTQVEQWVQKDLFQPRSQEPIITWLGHATFLIQIGGINIITDPVLGDPSIFFPRLMPNEIDHYHLPDIDVVLISHNHRDHMDAKTLHYLKKNDKTLYHVPHGDKRWFDRRGFGSVTEHVWWDQITLPVNSNQKVIFSFLPSKHWSQRGLFDKNKSLWGSWMIQWENYTIYFAGDTAYSHHFSHIADEFSTIDISLLPIGPGEPRDWMRHTHMDAHEAGQAFLDLQATHFVPMHWGTFRFGNDDFISPITKLSEWWKKKETELQEKTLHLAKVGKSFILPFSQPLDISDTYTHQEIQKEQEKQ